MISNEYKIISLEDGSEYRFSSEAFKVKVQEYVARKREEGTKITKASLILSLSETTNVSASAVCNWLYGKNGTGELDIVKKLAKALETDYLELMEKVEDSEINESEDNNMNSTVENKTEKVVWDIWHNYVQEELTLPVEVATKRAIRECVQYMVECIQNYIDSLGYSLYWSIDDPKMYTYKFDKVYLILRKNMADLPFELYVELEKFIEEDMKPIIYYYKNMTPSEFDEYAYYEALSEVADQCERGISNEEMLWEMSEELKKECKPLFDKLHEIIKAYI